MNTNNPPPPTAAPPPATPPPATPHTSTAGTSAAVLSLTMCGSCGKNDCWILHYLKFNQLYRKLCTPCVLKLYPMSYCPTCFNLHDPNSINSNSNSNSTNVPSMAVISNSSNSKTLTCFKCSRLSHSTCVPPNAPKSPYICALCTAKVIKIEQIFDFRKKKRESDGGGGGGGGGDSKSKVLEGDQKQVLDERAARMLLLAARISAITISKSASLTRENAEKKVKEAALAKRRAKEAIDYVAFVSAKVVNGGGGGGGINNSNKQQRRESEVPASTGMKGAGAGAVVVPVRLEKNGGVGRANAVAAAAAGVNSLEIKNVEKLNSNNNGSVAVPGKSAPQHSAPQHSVPQHLQKNIKSSIKNNNGGGGGKDGTGP